LSALDAAQATLSVSVTGPGTVSASAASPISGSISSCTSNCSAIYSAEDGGDSVTLTAATLTGVTFTGWSGDCSGTTLTHGVTMSADRNCTATFSYQPPNASG